MLVNFRTMNKFSYHMLIILWIKMKYEWLSFKSYSASELEQAIEEIGNGFGSKYMLTFF